MRRLLVALALPACTAASPSLGLEDLLQISGAQYRPGPFPVDHGGPRALVLDTMHTMIPIGRTNEQATGLLESSAHSAIFGIVGFDGAWILPTGPAGATMPDRALAQATIGLAESMPPGPFTLQLAAGDENGVIGASATTDVIAIVTAPPPGQLVVSLEWSGAADLDVHVVDPLGGEAWSDVPNTYRAPPPGTFVPANDFLKGGILDHDGNANCRRDGEPNEHVIWHLTDALAPTTPGMPVPLPPPPSGEYIVRVDARAMCGDPAADWHAFANLTDGTVVGEARGIAVPDDVSYQTHAAGAGVLALRFTLP